MPAFSVSPEVEQGKAKTFVVIEFPRSARDKEKKLDSLRHILHQFQQNPAGARGMDKDVEMSTGADLDFLRHKARTGLLEIFHGLREIRDVDGDVVQTLTALGNEFGNH